MPVGTVISTLDSPSTRKFSFVVAGKGVKRGQFVQAASDEGIVLGWVSDIQRANRYFERAESVSEYERNSSFLDNFPAGEWEYVVASCSVLGAWEAGLKRSAFPLAPGVKVERIDETILKQVLGFSESGLDFGKLQQHDVAVKLDLNRLLQKHLAILGISGSGKSVCATVLIEELLSRPPEAGRMAVVVFDVHGEYSCFADRKRNPSFAEKAFLVDCTQVRLATHKLSGGRLRDYLPEVSGTQARDFDKVVRGLKQRMKEGGIAPSLQEVIAEVEKAPLKDNVRGPLVGWLFELRRLRSGRASLFGRGDFPRLKEVIAPGKVTIFDLSGVTNQKVKQIIVEHFSKKLFKARQAEKVPPFLLLVEEAHNFAREKAPKGASISKGIIETIAREGRKFGASLCLVSQR
ncbi:MAG: ATP-binding protein, partial [Candidatus Micrarchaeota archaeon]